MLRDRAAEALERAGMRLAGRHALGPAQTVFDHGRRALGEPMRVALAGRVSSGKSTLVNALVGGDLLRTGPTALTYTVTELRYAKHSALTLHYRDARPSHRRPLDDLGLLTARGDGTALEGIDHVTIDGDFPYLQAFHLIDTPGLESQFVEDTAAAMRTVQLAADELRADAVVLVVDRGLAGSDRDLLAQVQGESFGVSPITTVGVLTKVERFWPQFGDPLAEGRRVAGLLMGSAGASRMLYQLRPVCSLVGAAAGAFTGEEFEDLCRLSTVDDDVLARKVARARLFTTREYAELPVPAKGRARLFGRFGGYGTVLATRLIRQGIGTVEELRTELAERSGLTELRELLVDHFGHRRDLIKLRRVIDQVRALPARMETQLSGAERVALTDAIAEVERLAHDEHAFAELVVLQRHYEGTTVLPAEQIAELLRVTGDHGRHITARLGLPPHAGVADMTETAQRRLAYWSRAAADPTAQGGSREVARLLRRSYERILHHIDLARRHLEMAL